MSTFLLTNLSLVNHIFASQKIYIYIYNANFTYFTQLLRNCDVGSCMCIKLLQSYSTLQTQWTIATRHLCPLDSPGKSTGVSYALFQGNLPYPGTKTASSVAPALQILLGSQILTILPSDSQLSLMRLLSFHSPVLLLSLSACSCLCCKMLQSFSLGEKMKFKSNSTLINTQYI